MPPEYPLGYRRGRSSAGSLRHNWCLRREQPGSDHCHGCRISGDPSLFTLGSVGYVLAFSAAGAGFGILAISYRRRTGLSTTGVLLGTLGAPVMLGSILVLRPALLRMAGLLSA